jgi:hypothetical protein
MVRGNVVLMKLPSAIWFAFAFAMIVTPAMCQSTSPGGMPPPTGMSLEESNAMRFPQPVRTGDLLHRLIQQPVESQTILGRVHGVVRNSAGEVFIIMNIGGFYGYGGRLIAVPINAMVLLGDAMEVVAFTPAQLAAFPTFNPAGAVPVPDDAILDVGLAKPSHHG